MSTHVTNFTNSTTKYLALGLSALTLIGILGMGTITGQAGFLKKNPAAQKALRSGDLAAFREAVQTTDEQGRISRRVKNLDEAEFIRLQEVFLQTELLQQAITANDYDAYREIVASLEAEGIETRMGRRHGLKMIAETEEEFAQLVQLYAEKEALQTELRVAVEAEDKDTFGELVKEHRTRLRERLVGVQNTKTLPPLSEDRIEDLYRRAQEAIVEGEEISLRPERLRY